MKILLVKIMKIFVYCGTIHDYQCVTEISFKDMNMNMSNILFYKKSICKRKNIYISYVYILEKLITT